VEWPSLHLVEAISILLGMRWGCGRHVFRLRMSSFASVFNEDSPLAHGADPGEVTEEGAEVFFEDTDALCS